VFALIGQTTVAWAENSLTPSVQAIPAERSPADELQSPTLSASERQDQVSSFTGRYSTRLLERATPVPSNHQNAKLDAWPGTADAQLNMLVLVILTAIAVVHGQDGGCLPCHLSRRIACPPPPPPPRPPAPSLSAAECLSCSEPLSFPPGLHVNSQGPWVDHAPPLLPLPVLAAVPSAQQRTRPASLACALVGIRNCRTCAFTLSGATCRSCIAGFYAATPRTCRPW
jgi:hypothetical protein